MVTNRLARCDRNRWSISHQNPRRISPGYGLPSELPGGRLTRHAGRSFGSPRDFLSTEEREDTDALAMDTVDPMKGGHTQRAVTTCWQHVGEVRQRGCRIAYIGNGGGNDEDARVRPDKVVLTAPPSVPSPRMGCPSSPFGRHPTGLVDPPWPTLERLIVVRAVHHHSGERSGPSPALGMHPSEFAHRNLLDIRGEASDTARPFSPVVKEEA